MTVCDLSPFYCEKGGGIRTYHRARIDWFSRQNAHRYLLIAPGPRTRVSAPAPSVQLLQVYGPRLTRDSERYRLLLDYRAVRTAIIHAQPDVLEVHDPWFSAGFGLLLRHRGAFRGVLSCFCHSDPVTTYVQPRLARWLGPGHAAAKLTALAHDGFRVLQKGFDATCVASDDLGDRLRRTGVSNVVKVGFGLDPAFLDVWRPRSVLARRFLYAGRLDDDKEFALVLNVLPELLRRPGVTVTIIGVGAHETRVARLAHPRLHYRGFVADVASMRAAYASHDVLLAPGRFETFGMAALEAAAAGLVVVGPDQGGTGELLRQMASPLMFPAGDRRMFLDRIEMTLEGPLGDLVDRGRALARGYGTWNEAVARHIAIYESMLGVYGDREAHRLLA